MERQRQATRYFRQLWSQLSAEYQMIRWIIVLFIGGFLDTIGLSFLVAYFLTSQTAYRYYVLHETIVQASVNIVTPTFYAWLIFGMIVVGSLPIIFSILLSPILPVKRIVSPLGIQIIGTILFLVSVIGSYLLAYSPSSLVLLLFFTAYGGLLSDSFVKWFLGRAIMREDIFTFTIRAGASLEKVNQIITDPRHQKLFLIQSVPIDEQEENADRITYRGDKVYPNRFYLQLQRVEPKEQENVESICSINIVAYRLSGFSFIRTVNLDEWIHKHIIAYLEEIFRRKDYQIKYDEYPDSDVDELVQRVIYENQGFVARTQGAMTRITVLKISIGVVSIIIGILFLVFGPDENYRLSGIGILALLAVYALADLPNRIESGPRTRRKVRPK